MVDGPASGQDVPKGAAVFPMIPPDLNIHPLLLAVLHVTVFLDGSENDVVDPDAAGEVLEYIGHYLQRLDGSGLRRTYEDMQCLATYARQQKWPKQQIQFLKTFLTDFGVAEEEKT